MDLAPPPPTRGEERYGGFDESAPGGDGEGGDEGGGDGGGGDGDGGDGV